MGLAITAYRQIRKKAWDHTSPQNPTDAGFFWAYCNKDFPGRNDTVEHREVYAFAERFDFSAGSYGGYGDWREELAIMAGWPLLRSGDREAHAFSAWRATSGPFWELIHFADNEGVIGATTAAKLAKDFAEYQSKADAHPDDWFRDMYAKWRKAFEIAADGGAVDFH